MSIMIDKFNEMTNSLLEPPELTRGQGVGLADDRDDVDTR